MYVWSAYKICGAPLPARSQASFAPTPQVSPNNLQSSAANKHRSRALAELEGASFANGFDRWRSSNHNDEQETSSWLSKLITI